MESALREAIDALLAIDLEACADVEIHETLMAGTRELSRLTGALARVAGEWDARMLWASDGSRAAWSRLSRETGASPRTAKAQVWRARQLQSMPATEAALSDGRLSVDQAELLINANQPGLEQFFMRDETMLI